MKYKFYLSIFLITINSSIRVCSLLLLQMLSCRCAHRPDFSTRVLRSLLTPTETGSPTKVPWLHAWPLSTAFHWIWAESLRVILERFTTTMIWQADTSTAVSCKRMLTTTASRCSSATLESSAPRRTWFRFFPGIWYFTFEWITFCEGIDCLTTMVCSLPGYLHLRVYSEGRETCVAFVDFMVINFWKDKL